MKTQKEQTEEFNNSKARLWLKSADYLYIGKRSVNRSKGAACKETPFCGDTLSLALAELERYLGIIYLPDSILPLVPTSDHENTGVDEYLLNINIKEEELKNYTNNHGEFLKIEGEIEDMILKKSLPL